VDHRPSTQPVFLNRHGQALTRYGIHTLVERYARQAALTMPTLRTKRVSPHTIRHYAGDKLPSRQVGGGPRR
jgi:integrase/recombinase XerD